MPDLQLAPTAIAQWQALVSAADADGLGEELESYLVHTLVRFTERPDALDRLLALDFLAAMQTPGSARTAQLREVGDRCLLLSGLFPEQANQRLVTLDYFVAMGRTAYHETAARLGHGAAALYRELATAFTRLLDVLYRLRSQGSADWQLQPLTAMEAWQATGSPAALAALRRHSKAIPA